MLRWSPLRASRRQFFQKLNEAHLVNQLKDIAGVVRGERAPMKPAARRAALSVGDAPSSSSTSFAAGNNRGSDFDLTRSEPRAGPWDNYESFGRKVKPRWQDLTHSEAVDVQRKYSEKLLLDRKIHWLKQQKAPSPSNLAKAHMRDVRKAREEAEERKANGGLPVKATKKGPELYQRLMDDTRRLEFESRERMKIRAEKRENAKIIKQPVPRIGEAPLDPIEQHIERRKVRINAMLMSHIEQALTANTSQILHDMLEGASLTVIGITADSPRGIHNVYYQIANVPPGRDRAWVEARMNTLAPKIRSQMALKLQLGYTPELRFRPLVYAVKTQHRQRLLRIARRLRHEKAQHLLTDWVSEMNWGASG